MYKPIVGVCLVAAAALAACGGGGASTAAAPRLPLTLRASVNGASAVDVTAPHALNLPNIGDSAVVTAYEEDRQVPFALSADASCANIVVISPQTSAMQQGVTATATGECNARIRADDGSTATLGIFSLPPP